MRESKYLSSKHVFVRTTTEISRASQLTIYSKICRRESWNLTVEYTLGKETKIESRSVKVKQISARHATKHAVNSVKNIFISSQNIIVEHIFVGVPGENT